MCASRMAVLLVSAAVAWPVGDATAISRRTECRLSCGAAIDRCVAEGGRRRRCKRRTLRDCRRDGLETCATTSTSTTTPSATTSLPGASTTTEVPPSTVVGATTSTAGATTTSTPGGSTTSLAEASTTTTPDTSTTTAPEPSTTSTTFPEVHGCTSANAIDRSGPSDDRTITFAPYAYTPKCMRIAAGQTVTFSGTFAGHPLVGGEIVGFDATPDPSSPITPTSTGTTKDVLFENPGVFPFYCDFHGVTQGMDGAVQVTP